MTDERKKDHLRICVEEDVESGSTGLEDVRLTHMALPELDFDDISMETRFLGKALKYPLILEAITGGVSKAKKINHDIAGIAEEFGIGFGVGSQRMALVDPELADTYRVRNFAPDIFLIANLGAVQLNYGFGLDECRKAVDMIEADALALHINPLQEAVQPEGDRNFSGLIEKINSVSEKLGKPVIAKCVGSGISYETAKRLRISAIDVGGSGGTSWSLIEGLRGDSKTKKIGETFAGWGIPTAESIREVSRLNVPVIGSGGIRTGLDAAKAIALGADCVGIALPVLRAWSSGGKKEVRKFLDRFITELRIAMFLSGSKNIKELRGKIKG
ncbi:MAG: type 2 isopentenyl-diphosphate Delta-isomerase [Candidatus Altiarchaeota archaeon]|nr:type 2 isopentenyl-diphosphate Delta-isomerase [Candidatus Altiarchaeota archaeon]